MSAPVCLRAKGTVGLPRLLCASLLSTFCRRNREFDLLSCVQKRLQLRNGMQIDLTHIDHHPEIIK